MAKKAAAESSRRTPSPPLDIEERGGLAQPRGANAYERKENTVLPAITKYFLQQPSIAMIDFQSDG